MYDLTQLTLQNVPDIGVALRSFGKEADSSETVASHCVQYLYQNFVDSATEEPACALIRFFKTHFYGNLPTSLQAQIKTSGDSLPAEVKCLTLL